MSKSLILLELFTRLHDGEKFSKKEMAELAGGVSERTIQRYVSTINMYFEERESSSRIAFDSNLNQFYLDRRDIEHFGSAQILMLCKILLSTRALSKEEVLNVMENLLDKIDGEDRRYIEDTIRSEKFHYVPLLEEQPLVNKVWDINSIIQNGSGLIFEYSNAMNAVRTHTVKPLYITFSEFYFYLVGVDEKERVLIYRIDRIMEYEATSENIQYELPYYLNEGELKKRIYFMYGGSLKRVVFEFSDGIIESVMDRFPTAKLIKKDYKNNKFTVEVEVVGDGILMWLLSQGAKVKLLSPESLVKDYRNEIKKMYGNL